MPKPSSKGRSKKRRKSSSGPSTGMLVGIGMAVVLVGALVVGGIMMIRNGTAGNVLDNISQAVGASDTPLSLAQDLKTINDDWKEVLLSIQDVPSAERAIPKAKQILKRFRDLEERAANAPPATEEQHKEANEWKRQQAQNVNFEESMIEIPLTSSQLPDELEEVMFELRFAQSSARNMVDSLKPLPEPQNEMEEIERDVTVLRQKRAKAISTVSTQKDVDRVSELLRSLTSEVRALTERKQTAENARFSAGQAKGKYMQFQMATVSVLDRMEVLNRNSVNYESLQQADADFSSAVANYDTVQPGMASGGGRGLPDSISSQPGIPQYNGGQSGGRPSFPGRMGGGGGGENPMTKAAEPNEVVLHYVGGVFDNTGKSPGEVALRTGELIQAIRNYREPISNIPGAKPMANGVTSGLCVQRVQYSDDPQKLADSLPFGKVASVDVQKRLVVVSFE